MKRDLKGWGPFAVHMMPEDRRACLRCLRTILSLLYGSRAGQVMDLVRRAEDDGDLLAPACAALTALPEADRRRIVMAYAAVEVG
nr:hypothetical protein NG677_04250 [Methylobacterium sp. OTU13CASTA1]